MALSKFGSVVVRGHIEIVEREGAVSCGASGELVQISPGVFSHFVEQSLMAWLKRLAFLDQLLGQAEPKTVNVRLVVFRQTLLRTQWVFVLIV